MFKNHFFTKKLHKWIIFRQKLHYNCITNCYLRYGKMTYNELHIGEFSSKRYLSIKIFALGLFSTFIIKITQKTWFRTGIFKRLIKKFNSFNVDNVRLFGELQNVELSKEQAEGMYIKAEKVLKEMNEIYYELEKDKFFGNKELEGSVEKALLSFYKIEAHLNAITTSDIDCSEQDAPLIEFASDISLGSLQA